MLYFKLLCMRYSLKKILIGFGAVLLSFSAIGCQNDDYLQDGGKHNPYYNGTVVDYLSKKLYFTMGEDSVRDLRQIKPEVWKEFLSMYVIPGKYCLKDIPQLDTAAVSAYPGGAYYSLAGKPMNMGVVYYDASGVKYAGPRQILYSYVNDFASMDMINAYVASCDIQPFNGVVHVIRFTNHNFGFDRDVFVQKAIGAGILSLEEVKRREKEYLVRKKEEDRL